MAGGRLEENNLRSKRFHRILATSVALSRYNKTRLNTKFTKDQFENCRRIGATESQPRAQEVQDLTCVTHSSNAGNWRFEIEISYFSMTDF